MVLLSIYKDKKRGTYYFITRIPKMGGGTRQVKRRGFSSRQEARKAEADVVLNAEQYDSDNPSFNFIADEYLKWYKRRRKESSYYKVESIIRVNLKTVFGRKKLKDISNRDVTKLQDDLLDDDRSINHVKKVHQILSAIFNFAIKQEYTLKNPARNVGNVDLEEERHINYWTLEEFKHFISQVDDYLYKTLFTVLYYSGMRKGEISALVWSDIDFEGNTIRIDKTAYNGLITKPKTTSSERTISMPDFTMKMLQKLKISKGCEQKTGYYVFGNFYDHLPATTLDRHYHKYLKNINKKIRLHDFRHSHASYLINKGAIPKVVANRLGHKDVATTLNTYSHLYPSTEKEIITQMEDDFKTADVIQLKVN